MIKVYLDGHEITEQINAQYPLPSNPGGVLPEQGPGKWYNLLRIINEVPALRESFFQGGVHQFTIVDETGRPFEVKLLLRSKYSARNH